MRRFWKWHDLLRYMVSTSKRMGVLLHLALRLVTMGFLFFWARIMEFMESRQRRSSLISSLAITTRLALWIQNRILRYRYFLFLQCMYYIIYPTLFIHFDISKLWFWTLLKLRSGMDEIWQIWTYVFLWGIHFLGKSFSSFFPWRSWYL